MQVAKSTIAEAPCVGTVCAPPFVPLRSGEAICLFLPGLVSPGGCVMGACHQRLL